MSFEVHREPMYRRYYSGYASASFCYAVVYGATLLILPLVLAYNSVGFWYKEGVYYEQPAVNYKYQAIVELFGKSSSSGSSQPFSLYFSNSPALNILHSDSLRSPVLQSAEFDDNLDGITDRIEVSVQMPLQSTETISGMATMLMTEVELRDRARVKFDSATLVNYNSGSAINNVHVEGDVTLRQTWPLSVRGGKKEPYAGSPLLPKAIPRGTSEDFYSLRALSERMASRNLSTTFVHTMATADHPALTSISKDVQYFKATIVLRVPKQSVWFTPSVSEVMKWAVIQYISLFLIVYVVLNRASTYVFRHQLLYAYSSADIVTEKLD